MHSCVCNGALIMCRCCELNRGTSIRRFLLNELGPLSPRLWLSTGQRDPIEPPWAARILVADLAAVNFYPTSLIASVCREPRLHCCHMSTWWLPRISVCFVSFRCNLILCTCGAHLSCWLTPKPIGLIALAHQYLIAQSQAASQLLNLTRRSA